MLGPSPRRSCRPSSMMLFKAGLVDLRLSDASERTSASASLTPNIAAAPNPTPRTFKRSRKARLESPLSFISRCISWACWSFSLSLILASHLTKTWQQALDFERAAPKIRSYTVFTMKCQVPDGDLPGYFGQAANYIALFRGVTANPLKKAE
jgi:hypothetical protein